MGARVLAPGRPTPAPTPEDEDQDEDQDEDRDDDRRYPVLIGAGPPRDGPGASAYSGELLGSPSAARADGRERVALPALMTGATVALVTVGVALTVVAGPLYGLADSRRRPHRPHALHLGRVRPVRGHRVAR